MSVKVKAIKYMDDMYLRVNDLQLLIHEAMENNSNDVVLKNLLAELKSAQKGEGFETKGILYASPAAIEP